ncbi:MAG: DUF2800 domain-containing protein, partial [Niameybacter sp.]|uniref:DUF2800 domain-containing protein n=1 Tax=Niameybacter sp. TaxID=2033640 RepID=UPI002FC9A9C0
MPNAHARLSASGAKRWLVCHPSVRLEEEFPEQSSSYAEEGTVAHSLGELHLRLALGELTKAQHKKQLNTLKKEHVTYYSQEMEEAVATYVEAVMELYLEAKSNCPDAMIMLEQRVDFSEWVPDGFGTGDVIIIADNSLHIADLKFGRGVKVDAEDNPQLKLYALGAFSEYAMLYDIAQVKMTIIQPRLDHISTSELVIEDLLEWADTYVKPRALLAYNGEGEFIPGEETCRFCKAKYVCRARGVQQLELMKHDLQSADTFSEDEIAELLTKVGPLVEWAKDIADYAYKQATENHVRYTGWKLIEGRSTRRYKDGLEVAKVLKQAGYEEAIIFEKNLLGITAMEKALGKKVFKELLEGLVEKPQGKP